MAATRDTNKSDTVEIRIDKWPTKQKKKLKVHDKEKRGRGGRGTKKRLRDAIRNQLEMRTTKNMNKHT